MLVLVLISIPFWPVSYLKYGIFVPLGLAAAGFLFNGCTISKYQPELHGRKFMYDYFNKIHPISEDHAERLSTLILVSITTIGYIRLMKANKE